MAYYPMNFKWQEVEEQHIREDVYLNNMHTHKVFSDKMKMTFLNFIRKVYGLYLSATHSDYSPMLIIQGITTKIQ